jgi:hypothetical protein
MFCYIYGDLIGFYIPGGLQRIMDGKFGFGPVTPILLLGFAVVMSAPAIMVALTLLLKPGAGRWLNVIMGLAETALMLYTMIDAWKFGYAFYIYLGVVEVTLTLLIVWFALTWPRSPEAGRG